MFVFEVQILNKYIGVVTRVLVLAFLSIDLSLFGKKKWDNDRGR